MKHTTFITVPLHLWVSGFPIWVLLLSGLAWCFPAPFIPLKPLIVPGLGVIMFSMGLTLRGEDFLRVGKQPKALLCGLLGQFLIMPAVAFLLGWALQLSPDIRLGLIIVGACPGGTASNVIAFLAKADVALSVSMTACSTLLAILLTPVIIYLLGGHYLPIDPLALFLSVLKIVFIPLGAGFLMRRCFETKVAPVQAYLPALAVAIIVLIIAIVVALTQDRLAALAGLCGLAVVLHNGLGLLLGYLLASLFQLPPTMRRTIAIEVGMQNSGLGVALAMTHFNATVAIPSSLFSVLHNLSGSLLAKRWGRDTRALLP